jgi:hypothetical protein
MTYRAAPGLEQEQPVTGMEGGEKDKIEAGVPAAVRAAHPSGLGATPQFPLHAFLECSALFERSAFSERSLPLPLLPLCRIHWTATGGCYRLASRMP